MSKKKSRVDQYDIMISNNLCVFRLERLKSQAEIASILGVSIQQVEKYERGINRVPAGKLYILAKTFEVSIEGFFNFTDENYKIISNVRYSSNKGVRLLKYYDELNSVQKKAILDLIKAIVRNKEQITEES